MQKQKNKNKLKGRDLNRKGAEKEGTDMDAFVNSAQQPVQTEGNSNEQESLSSKTVTNITVAQSEIEEISTKEKEMCEIKPDAEPETVPDNTVELNIKVETVIERESSLIDKMVPQVKNDKDTSKEPIPAIEDSNKCADILDEKTDDVVDHANIKNAIDVEAIVAQKNEENSKVSANLSADTPTAIEQQNDNEQTDDIENAQTTTSTVQPLKYQYNPSQWSPRNIDGKKEYDREFLMKLQDDPQSRIRPPNLPDLEVVLKDCSRVRISPFFNFFKINLISNCCLIILASRPRLSTN